MIRGYARILHGTWKEALERASDLRFLWWAILGLNQYSACDPAEAAEQALIQYPAIFRHPHTSQLRDQITADGFVPVF